MGNGKYILMNLHPHNIPLSQKQTLLIENEWGNPIIAHPERYKAVQDNLNLILIG